MGRLISRNSIQVTGFLLWRFGLLLAAATGIYRVTRFLLRLIDLPEQLEVGVGFVFAGAILFFISMVMERVVDARLEGDLSE